MNESERKALREAAEACVNLKAASLVVDADERAAIARKWNAFRSQATAHNVLALLDELEAMRRGESVRMGQWTYTAAELDRQFEEATLAGAQQDLALALIREATAKFVVPSGRPRPTSEDYYNAGVLAALNALRAECKRLGIKLEEK